jgi:hypothetical protein
LVDYVSSEKAPDSVPLPDKKVVASEQFSDKITKVINAGILRPLTPFNRSILLKEMSSRRNCHDMFLMTLLESPSASHLTRKRRFPDRLAAPSNSSR